MEQETMSNDDKPAAVKAPRVRRTFAERQEAALAELRAAGAAERARLEKQLATKRSEVAAIEEKLAALVAQLGPEA